MDILIAGRSGDRLFSIQVKTRTTVGGDGGWHMHEKHEEIRAERLFYAFADLGKPDGEAPDYYIIPSNQKADAVRVTHEA
ncbi:hypothetical protein DEA8626_02319 [Defluviimonas aquaemixtae]|uniref:PD(D/E)XK endonuclease domain-containing protein n=1 Tax=Albidovulum aquaemixtae TaxID=1542388 RepID=A0A2R8B7Y5_9RHOB|nr:hypothetical protein [Defluviimonas aquaemixtae]SPH18775.1 hypothetical protein DEA8626_02319 [Defluviimonas aquaemixtae]